MHTATASRLAAGCVTDLALKVAQGELKVRHMQTTAWLCLLLSVRWTPGWELQLSRSNALQWVVIMFDTTAGGSWPWVLLSDWSITSKWRAFFFNNWTPLPFKTSRSMCYKSNVYNYGQILQSTRCFLDYATNNMLKAPQKNGLNSAALSC